MSTVANPDSAADLREHAAEQQRQRQQDRIELHGVARELFVARFEDTFTLDVHGHTIEFYRPMDAAGVDLDDLDPETAERIERGSELLDRYEQRQQRLLQGVQGGESLADLLSEANADVDLLAEILATHAVDESLADPAVWRAMYRNDEKLGELFEDFFQEGESGQTQQQLDALENMLSGNSSTN